MLLSPTAHKRRPQANSRLLCSINAGRAFDRDMLRGSTGDPLIDESSSRNEGRFYFSKSVLAVIVGGHDVRLNPLTSKASRLSTEQCVAVTQCWGRSGSCDQRLDLGSKRTNACPHLSLQRDSVSQPKPVSPRCPPFVQSAQTLTAIASLFTKRIERKSQNPRSRPVDLPSRFRGDG